MAAALPSKLWTRTRTFERLLEPSVRTLTPEGSAVTRAKRSTSGAELIVRQLAELESSSDRRVVKMADSFGMP
jgi:hypothetical protein